MATKTQNMKLVSVKVDKLLYLDKQELMDRLTSNINLVYHDGVVVSKPQETIMMAYILSVLRDTKTPLLVEYHITNFYNNGLFSKDTINKCYEVIVKRLVEHNPEYQDRKKLAGIYKQIFQINNDIYNNIACKQLRSVSSIHICDLLELQLQDDLLEALFQARQKPSIDTINNTYVVLDNVINRLRNNTVSKYYLSGTVNANQIKQLLGSRGYITELNNAIFPKPVVSSFTLGMNTLYELAIESRAGAKALHLSNKAVQETEYFARELQLLTMSLERLVDTDCFKEYGEGEYLEWMINNENDLSLLQGKWLDNDTVISKDDHHLINNVVKLRSVLNCRLPNPQEVCTKCFGTLAYTIATHSNIGHFCATVVTQKLTQSILSTKHLSSSAIGNSIQITSDLDNLFHVRNNNTYIRASVNPNKTKISLRILQSEFKQLSVLRNVSNLEKVNPINISRIYNLGVIVNGEEYMLFKPTRNRYVSLSHPMLFYLLDIYKELDLTTDYCDIDLSRFISERHGEPIIVIPNMEYNFLSLSKAIKSVFRNLDPEKHIPENVLQEVYNLVNSKLNVNLSILETIVAAFQCRQQDYVLSRDPKNRRMVKSTAIIRNRSLSAAYDWEKVLENTLSPFSFYRTGVLPHPLDSIIIPSI